MGKGEGKGDGKGDGKGGGCCNCFGGDDRPVAPDPTGMARSCTDILFLLAFIAFWVGMVFCAIMGFKDGDPMRLLYFVDYNGQRCGTGDLKDYKYTHWTHPANSQTNVCVSSCPSKYEMFELKNTATYSNTTTVAANGTTTTVAANGTGTIVSYGLGYERTNGSWTNELLTGQSVTIPGTNATYTSGSTFPTFACVSTWSSTSDCLMGVTPVLGYIGYTGEEATGGALAAAGSKCCTIDDVVAPPGMYFCVPKSLGSAADGLAGTGLGNSYAKEYIEKGTVIIASATADLAVGWYVLVCCLGISLLISFLWTYILKFCAGCFVWTAVVLSNIMALALAGACLFLYMHYSDEYDKNGLDSDLSMKWMCLIALFATGLLAFLLLCMTVCLCKQIRIAVGIIQEACMAVQRMPMVVFFPLVQYFWMLCFLVVWAVVAVYMASCGEYVKVFGLGYTMEWKEDMQKAMVYHFFALLWNMAFIRHMSILILAGVFGAYYWTPLEDKKAGKLPRAPILASMWRSWRYHTGTVAFGSFLIAVIQMIRAVLNYIKKKYLKDKPPCGAICSCFAKFLVCYIDCCLACFERLMEYISKNAYIVTACKGKMFCTAAWEAFKFIIGNLGQHAVVNWVSAFIMALGKMFIVAASVAPCFFIAGLSDDISSPWVLLLCCAIIAYLVACLFLGVVDTAIDVILVCFCWERDAAGNFQNGQVYASDGLNKFIAGIQHAKDNLAKNNEGGGGAEPAAGVQASAPPAETPAQ